MKKVKLLLNKDENFRLESLVAGTVTITYGERVENHARMEMIGKEIKQGFSENNMDDIRDKLTNKNIHFNHINLKDYAPSNLNTEDASIIIIPDGIRQFGLNPDEMLLENLKYDWDKKAMMYQKVVNKHARWNVCISDYEQEPSYDLGKGRIINFTDLPITEKLRGILPIYFGSKAEKLNAEGNYYYNTKVCGIGWHGDGERKIVIAVRLGVTIPLKYNWWYKNEHIGDICELNLSHGDMYIMSEKASGNDWKKKNIPTLRHSAGCEDFTKL